MNLSQLPLQWFGRYQRHGLAIYSSENQGGNSGGSARWILGFRASRAPASGTSPDGPGTGPR